MTIREITNKNINKNKISKDKLQGTAKNYKR